MYPWLKLLLIIYGISVVIVCIGMWKITKEDFDGRRVTPVGVILLWVLMPGMNSFFAVLYLWETFVTLIEKKDK